MRWEKAAQLLQLARMLAASGEGVPLVRLCNEFAVGRRTIERMMPAVEELFGPVERSRGDGGSLLYRLPTGAGDRLLTQVKAGELVELEHAIDAADASDTQGRAALLRTLHTKILTAMRANERNRIDVDLEGLLEAEALARRPGPRARVPAAVLDTLRQALLSGHAVEFRYWDRDDAYTVVPYGILFGLRSYLVCLFEGAEGDPYLYRLDRMRDVVVLDRSAARPAEFDLAAFAARSFGTFQEPVHDVHLRFAPRAVPDARAFQFHPTQVLEEHADGSLSVRFSAGGLMQIAHHLFTWGDTVRIVAPEALRAEMRACVDRAGAALAAG